MQSVNRMVTHFHTYMYKMGIVYCVNNCVYFDNIHVELRFPKYVEYMFLFDDLFHIHTSPPLSSLQKIIVYIYANTVLLTCESEND